MSLRCLISVLILFVVLVIFVSPAVDLPETALRSIQAFERLVLAILVRASIMVGLRIPLVRLEFLPNGRGRLLPALLLPALLLPLLC